jgi:phage tail-like protein
MSPAEAPPLAPPPAPPAVPLYAPPPAAPRSAGLEASSYLDFLPAIYQTTGPDGEPSYLGLFLRAFEDVLSGNGVEMPGETGTRRPSLEAAIDSLAALFVPLDTRDPAGTHQTPPEFLEWLAQWVAVALRADIDVPRRRRFIAHAVPVYRWRGTRRGLREAIRLYTDTEPVITEPSPELRVGKNTVVGAATLGGGLPHTFEVRLRLTSATARALGGEAAAERLRRAHEVVSSIIETTKPAHTVCTLVIEVPTFQIGIRSTIGLDSLVSSDPPAAANP